MEQLARKLEEFCLRKFISAHQHKLCQNTVNQQKIASFLNFDADQISIIMAPPDNFSRCSKMYECIEKTTGASRFLEALEETNNEHMIKFIESVLMDSPLKSGIWFNIPHEIDSFCGRKDFLSQLYDQLKPRNDSETEVTVLSQVKIVSGLGGIGKTETARKYISQYFEFYNNFIWIDAESENSMQNSFLKLAEEIIIPIKNSEGKSREIQEILKEIYNKICVGEKSNLIVFDNAEDYQSCRQFLPDLSHPKMKKPVILATSRNQEWKSAHGKIQVLPLDKMTDDESLEFILKQLEIPESEIPEFKEESKEFIELIGGLPLALQQAVSYIKEERELTKFLGTPYKISDYVREFKLSMKKFLSFSPVPPPDSSPTVFVTWNVTFEKIQKLVNGKEAIKMLEILSFLYADKIPSTFLHDLVPEIENRGFAQSLKLLEKYSMIKMNVRDFCLSIHRQLQFVILQYLKECDDVSNVVMNIVEKCEVILENIKLSECSDIFLNVHQIVSNHFNLIPETEKFLDFMHEFGEVLHRASRYSESLELFNKVYMRRYELLGQNHESTIEAQNNMATQLFQLGRYDESLKLFEQVLEKEEILFGQSRPEGITMKHNMATVLLKQKKYGESLLIFQQVLAQKIKILGENHPLTLVTQNAIASVHSNLDDFPKALSLYQDVEKKRIEILGPDHSDVLLTKHNKAGVLFKMGKLQEASKTFKQVYEKRKEILGENHLSTITTLERIAKTFVHEGKFTEALDIYQKTYEIRKTKLSEDHPSTITAKHNMANVLVEQKRYQEALEMFQQVLAQSIKIHGENHSVTLTTQNHIASLHSELGSFSKALVLYQQVEKKQAEILGPDDTNLLITKHNKAILLFKMGQFKEASKIFNEILEKRRKILGEDHLDTIKTLEWIGKILEGQGKFTEAHEMYKKVYEMRKTKMGQDHPQTIFVKSRIEHIESKVREKDEHL